MIRYSPSARRPAAHLRLSDGVCKFSGSTIKERQQQRGAASAARILGWRAPPPLLSLPWVACGWAVMRHRDVTRDAGGW